MLSDGLPSGRASAGWAFFTSMKPKEEIFLVAADAVPQHWTLENYPRCWWGGTYFQAARRHGHRRLCTSSAWF
jgi:ABC-type glycerol-3-phosphate transport system permease component